MTAAAAASVRRVFLLSVALPATACFYDETAPLAADFGACPADWGPTPGGVPEQPTWYRDVQPIVVEKCEGCHTNGGIGPFVIEGYSDIAQLAQPIYEVVESRRMPPWQPDPCCSTYRWDRSLTEDQRATMLRWIELGLPVGDPAEAPPVTPPAPGLPRVDLHAEMPAEYTPVPNHGVDEIRCFLLDHAPIDRTRYITGFDFHPGARPMVHHVIVYAIDADAAAELAERDGEDGRPGWDCWGDGGELAGNTQYIGGWQPGVPARLLPEGIGRELPADTRIMLNVHYDTGHGSIPDRSSLDIMLEDSVERLEKSAPVGNPLWFVGEGMEIAAGDPDASVWFAYDPTVIVGKGEAIRIHNVMLHMHDLGSIGRVAVLRRDGTTECLLNITEWDFHWMADYYFDEPPLVEPGDKLYVECHWDNTAENQPIVNGVKQEPRTLGWATEEEMCGAVLTFSVPLEDG